MRSEKCKRVDALMSAAKKFGPRSELASLTTRASIQLYRFVISSEREGLVSGKNIQKLEQASKLLNDIYNDLEEELEGFCLFDEED